VSSRLERLLHFVTSHSAHDVPKVGIGHGNAGRLFGFIAGKRTLNSASRKQPVVTECSDP
jgi:hypothetical protein